MILESAVQNKQSCVTALLRGSLIQNPARPLRATEGLGLVSLSVRSLKAVVDKLCLCFILALVSFRFFFVSKLVPSKGFHHVAVSLCFANSKQVEIYSDTWVVGEELVQEAYATLVCVV